ncbi:hypothetical protein, partial [Devosia sp.]|uniref:hypothetical protein n=1 Tax=Devosia sp. TaxID=1871048 RepID=UPI0037BEB65A
SSVNLLRFILWSLSWGQSLLQTGLAAGGNVTSGRICTQSTVFNVRPQGPKPQSFQILAATIHVA